MVGLAPISIAVLARGLFQSCSRALARDGACPHAEEERSEPVERTIAQRQRQIRECRNRNQLRKEDESGGATLRQSPPQSLAPVWNQHQQRGSSAVERQKNPKALGRTNRGVVIDHKTMGTASVMKTPLISGGQSKSKERSLGT
jgi:hypothetical protein